MFPSGPYGSCYIYKSLMGHIILFGMFASGRVSLTVNIALYINDHHIGFSHIDFYCSCMLGCSYWASPDYLVVKAWIRVTVTFPSFNNLNSSYIWIYVKVFPRVLGTENQVFFLIVWWMIITRWRGSSFHHDNIFLILTLDHVVWSWCTCKTFVILANFNSCFLL